MGTVYLAEHVRTGRPPFEAASSWDLMGMHMREPPPPLPAIGVDGRSLVTLPLRELLQQMLAKSPLGRPTMAEVAARLSGLLRHGQPGDVHSAGGMTESKGGASRRLSIGLLWGLLLRSLIATGLYARREHRLAELRRKETLAATQELLSVINRSLRPIPGATTASHALLDTTANLLGELHAQAPSDLSDSYQARLANAYDGMADVLELQSALLLAKTTYEKALAIRLTLLQHTPYTPSDPVRRQEAVATYLLHGDLLRTQGQQRLALIDYEQAETLLEPMWKREPDKKSYRWQMCGVLYRISQTQLSLGKSAASLAQAERALELLLRIAPTDQQGASYHLLLSRVLLARWDARERLGQSVAAEQDYSRALATVQGLLTAAPQDVQCRRALIDSGHKTIEQWLRLGKLDAAEPLATELVSAAESLLQTDGSHQGHKWRLSTSLQLFGDVLLQRKHPDEARRKFQRALELQESLRAQSPESSRHRDRAVLILERLGDAAQQGSFRSWDRLLRPEQTG